jgi:hypothetical protein
LENRILPEGSAINKASLGPIRFPIDDRPPASEVWEKFSADKMQKKAAKIILLSNIMVEIETKQAQAFGKIDLWR